MSIKLPLKIFTLEEANRLIPVLESLVGEFQSKYRKLEEHAIQSELHHRQTTPLRVSQSRKNREELNRLEQEVADVVKLIQQVGCVVRDPRQGLIDFPGVRDQEAIYLCWKFGEDQVRFYHGVEEGFQGRKPL